MKMCSDMLKYKIFSSDSNLTQNSAFKQSEFLVEVIEKLKVQPESVIEIMDEMRRQMFATNNIRILVSGDILSLESSLTPWKQWESKSGICLTKPTYLHDVLSDKGHSIASTMFVLQMPSIENSYLIHSTKGPSSWKHPDVAALKVLCEYLTTMEGIFWKEIRGAGLAYGCNLTVSLENGFVFCVIYRSPDVVKAFNAIKNIISRFIEKKIDFEETFFRAAKSSVLFEIISYEETPGETANEAFLNNVFRDKCNFRDYMLSEISKVSLMDIKNVLEKYLVALFDVTKSFGCTSVSDSKVENIDRGFKDIGFHCEKMRIDANL
jgi:Zn-dependent M16 (insulinase) family peptidase